MNLQALSTIRTGRTPAVVGAGLVAVLITTFVFGCRPSSAPVSRGADGKLEDEEALLRAAVQAQPENVPTRQRLVEYLLKRGRIHDALEELEATAEGTPARSPLRATRARLLMAASRLPEAAEALRPLAETDTRSRIDLALCLCAQGERVEAVRVLRRTGEVPPELTLQMGSAYLNALEPGLALPFLEKASSANPSSMEALTYHGTALMFTGRYQQARQVLKKAVEAAPGSAMPLFYYATALRLSGDTALLPEAEGSIRQALHAEPKNPVFWYELALIQLARGQPREALRSLQPAQADPELPEARRDLARLYQRLGNKREAALTRARYWLALRDPDRAVSELEPDQTNLRDHDRALVLVTSLREAGHAARALRILDQVRPEADGNPEALWERIRALRAQQRNDEALKALDKLAQLSPDDIRVLDERADILQPLARYDEVEPILVRLRDREPGNAFRHYQLGLFYVLWSRRADKNALAESSFLKALEIDPGFVGPRYRLAVLLQGDKRLDEAAQHLRLVLDASPEFAEAHQALGRVYTQLGDTGRADAAFRLAKRYLAQDAEKQRLERAVAGSRPRREDRLGLYQLHLRRGNLKAATRELEVYTHFFPKDGTVRDDLAKLLGYTRRFQRQYEVRTSPRGSAESVARPHRNGHPKRGRA